MRKAWLLERASGLSTAFIGSSNLSHTALFDGLEWNVRLSSVDAAHVIDRVRIDVGDEAGRVRTCCVGGCVVIQVDQARGILRRDRASRLPSMCRSVPPTLDGL